MKRIIKITIFGLFFGLILLYNGGALAEETGEGARAYVLLEAKTGRVLDAWNENEPLPMASTTKIMTALIALEQGDLQDTVTAGKNAFGVPGTSIYLAQGEQLTLEQMLYGLMLASGNDAAVAIAEHIGGTVEGFCERMNQRAREIGCQNTAFATPHGLPAEGHYTTAYDLALIAREAMKLPAFREIVSTQRASIPWAGHEYSRVLTNKNQLLSTYPGALGIKTGYTKAAGRCLAFAAERDGMELIGVMLNCPNWFGEAAALLDRGFANWQMATILSAGETVWQVPVTGGSQSSVALVAQRDVAAPVPIDRWPDLVLNIPDSLPAGIRAGQMLGEARLMDGSETLISVPLVAAEDVEERSFRRGWERLEARWPLAAGE